VNADGIPPHLQRSVLIASDFGTGAVLIRRGNVLAVTVDAAVRYLEERGAPVHMPRHARWVESMGGTVLVVDHPLMVCCVGRASDPFAVELRALQAELGVGS
jgi:hypothetical protein